MQGIVYFVIRSPAANSKYMLCLEKYEIIVGNEKLKWFTQRLCLCYLRGFITEQNAYTIETIWLNINVSIANTGTTFWKWNV